MLAINNEQEIHDKIVAYENDFMRDASFCVTPLQLSDLKDHMDQHRDKLGEFVLDLMQSTMDAESIGMAITDKRWVLIKEFVEDGRC